MVIASGLANCAIRLSVPDCEISVKLTPRASCNEIGLKDGIVIARVAAAPVDGQANEALIQLLAKSLHVAPSRIAIVRGESSRTKVLSVEGLSLVQVFTALASPQPGGRQ
jgi:uncharacterized protein YggU (UPF0235/DUF167 family)